MERFHRVALTTSLRSGRRVDGRGEEIGGSLLIGTVDVEEEVFHCERQIAVPASSHSPSRRSARGVAPFAGGLAVCNATEVFLFSPDLREIVASASHPWLGDIHSIAARGGVLYLSATAADAVLGLDESLRPVFDWWAGDEPELARHLEWKERGTLRDRFHLNHVAFDPAGDLIVNLPDLDPGPGESKLWNVTRQRFELPAPPGHPSDPFPGRIHDGVILEDRHYLGWTQAGRFLALCRRTGEVLSSVDCSVPLGTTTGHPVAARHGWLRGAVRLCNHLFLVGQSRLTLFLVDMDDGNRRGPLRLEGVIDPIDDPGLAVYCICPLPCPP
jgi:hypothetical protein